ncbi:MAG: AI-2E family transporter [Leptolyngbyaceae cyanobacterium SM2_3_12]|nr:AI-2E family transporter [Leptolyngbyaceae cyanobacterium SM2_3_12]
MNETLKALPRWLLWEVGIPLTVLNIWLLFKVFESFQSLLTILIGATVLSFLLDFLVKQLQQRGIRRGVSVLLIGGGALGLVAMVSLTLGPLLITQLSALIQALPSLLEASSQRFEAVDFWLDRRQIPLDLSALATQVAQTLPEEITQLPDRLLEVVLNVADQVLTVLFTGVLTIYLLLHGKAFWAGILQWLPDPWAEILHQGLREQFQNYFVGQATLAALMAGLLSLAFYGLGCLLAGVWFGDWATGADSLWGYGGVCPG